MSSKTVCKNCGKSFNSNFSYCPYCGQENREQPLRFNDFISEFLSANFNLDSKFILTLKTLIFKPALLTKEILNGKRTKYVTPVRLYLLISLIYFFVISFEQDSGIVINSNDTQNSSTVLSTEISGSDTLTGFKKILYDKLMLLKSKQGEKEFLRLFKKSISVGMFIFIPLTAWVLYLFFRKRYHYYIPHLIFLIHLQTLIFLILTIFSVIRFLYDGDFITGIEFIILTYLVYKWLKNFYSLSFMRTITNMILLSGIYLFLSLVFLVVISGISFYFF